MPPALDSADTYTIIPHRVPSEHIIHHTFLIPPVRGGQRGVDGWGASPCPGAVLRGPCTLTVELMLGIHLYMCVCVWVCLGVPECGISGLTLTYSSSKRCGSPVLLILLARCCCLLWLACPQGSFTRLTHVKVKPGDLLCSCICVDSAEILWRDPGRRRQPRRA